MATVHLSSVVKYLVEFAAIFHDYEGTQNRLAVVVRNYQTACNLNKTKLLKITKFKLLNFCLH